MGSKTEKVQRLLETIARLISASKLADDELEYREYLAAGRQRFDWTRRLSDEVRYLRITEVVDRDVEWEFTLLGGVDGRADLSQNSEGRRGGDLTYTADFFRRWMLELDEWDEIPREPLS